MTLAVYLRSVQKQQQFYTSRGKWRIASMRDLEYVLKGFAPPEFIHPLYPHLPEGIAEANSDIQSFIEGGIPRPLGSPLLRMLETFEERARSIYRNHPWELDHLYDIVAHDEERQELTIRQLASKVLALDESQLDDAIVFAVHRALSRHPFVIERDRTSVFTDHYLVQPKRVSKAIGTVVNWVREHQEHQTQIVTGKETGGFSNHPMQSFIQKARRLIGLSRKFRSPTMMSNVGPTAQRFRLTETEDGRPYRDFTTEAFTDTDRTIIEFLQLYCAPPRRMTSGVLKSTGSHIMRATGMYNTLLLHAGSLPLFLQELGVITPWENLNAFDQILALPGHGLSSPADQMMKDAWNAAEQVERRGLEDTMRDHRTDWGPLPVYCIDDPHAEEIDDGISFERVPGSDDTYWIRIHVANPSAFIPPEHIIARYAAFRYQTLYLPERTYPMLPPSVTQSHFSLAPGRPTLTMSAKVTANGDILETNIVNGYIRNVIYLTHDHLRDYFGVRPHSSRQEMTVGGDFSRRSRETLQTELSGHDQDTFRTLRQIMLAVRNQRKKNGAIEWPLHIATPVSVYSGPRPIKPRRLDVRQGRYILGDPIIQLQWRDHDPHEVPDLTKQDLVSTIMNLACWITGRWCADRNIPAVYDGTWYHPEYPKLTRQNISEYGGNALLYLAAPKGISSSGVIPHASIGVDAYVKSTSPLRRYVDLLGHYQIEAALRYERIHGRPLNARTTPSVLPFTKDQVDQYIDRSRWLRNRIKRCEMASLQFWACQFLFRAFYFNECALPDTFPCVVYQTLSHATLSGTGFNRGYVARHLPFGVRCQLLVPDGFGEISMLSVVEAKILSVDMAREVVLMAPIRVVKPFARTGEWA
jgi:RNB domain